jgi:hypothetical protein
MRWLLLTVGGAAALFLAYVTIVAGMGWLGNYLAQ